LEFTGEERDSAPAPADSPRDQIEFEIADAQHRLPHYGGAAPGESLDPCQQFRKGERLDEIVMPTGAQPADPGIDFADRTDDQDGRRDPVLPQLLHDSNSIEVTRVAMRPLRMFVPLGKAKNTSVDNQKRLWILTFLPRELSCPMGSAMAPTGAD